MSPEEQPQVMDNTVELNKPADKSSKKKKLKIMAAAVAAVLVLGGITAALVVRSIYNKPENVLATALGNYLLDGKDKNFDAKVTLGLEEAVMGASEVELTSNVQMSGKTTQIDLKIDASIISLGGSIQSNENGNLYVKIDDLPSLLASGAGEAYGLTPEMSAQVAALDGKWIEIKPEDMTALTGQQAGTSSLDKCTTALYAAMDDDSLADAVDKEYRKNKFLTVKSEQTEVVDGQKLLRVEVGLDKEKLGSFGKALGGSTLLTTALTDCGLVEEEDATSSAELRDGELTVWLNRAKKELVKLEATGDSYTDGQKGAELAVTVDVKEPNGKIEAPADTVNILTLMQSFGIDPSMLSGAAL